MRATTCGRARALNLEGLVDVGLGDLDGCRASVRVVRPSSPAPLGDDFDARSRPAQHRVARPSCRGDLPLRPRAVCRRQCTLRRDRPDQRRPRLRPVPAPTWPAAWRPMRSRSSSKRSSRGPCCRGRRRTCCWPSPRRRSPRATGRARRQPRTRRVALLRQPVAVTSTGCRRTCSPLTARTEAAELPRRPPAPAGGASRRPLPARRRSPSSPQALLLGARLAECGPLTPGGRADGGLARRGSRLPRSDRPARSGSWAGSPSRSAVRSTATSAACCGRATSGSGRSTSTGPRSAARSCAPSRRATAPDWPSSGPARHSPRVTRASCCAGPSGGVPPPSPIPSAVDQHDPATTADLAALRAQHRVLPRRAPTGRRPTGSRPAPPGSSSPCGSACSTCAAPA